MRAELSNAALADMTVNEYVGTLKQLSRWAVRTSRLPSDPLAVVKKQSAKTIEKKRPRRALSPDEIGALLEAASARPLIELRTVRTGKRRGQLGARVRPGVAAKAEARGQNRRVSYLLALWTGLRRSELRALEWRDVELDSLPARITLRAATTKAKRADSIVLHPQIAEELGAIRPRKASAWSHVVLWAGWHGQTCLPVFPRPARVSWRLPMPPIRDVPDPQIEA